MFEIFLWSSWKNNILLPYTITILHAIPQSYERPQQAAFTQILIKKDCRQKTCCLVNCKNHVLFRWLERCCQYIFLKKKVLYHVYTEAARKISNGISRFYNNNPFLFWYCCTCSFFHLGLLILEFISGYEVCMLRGIFFHIDEIILSSWLSKITNNYY